MTTAREPDVPRDPGSRGPSTHEPTEQPDDVNVTRPTDDSLRTDEPAADDPEADNPQADNPEADNPEAGKAAENEASPKKEELRLWPEGTVFGPADKICLALIVLVTIFSFVMLPARPVILTWAPLALVALTGSRSGMVACGALAATGGLGMPMPFSVIVPLVVGTLSIVKFDLIYWWAGKLWGDWFIVMLAGQTKGSRKRADRAERIARKWMIPAIGVTYVPVVPIPAAVIYAVLGASGTTFKKFVLVDLSWAVLAQVTYFTMGWFIGEPAVKFLDELAKYSLWLAGAIFVFILIASFRAQAGRARTD